MSTKKQNWTFMTNHFHVLYLIHTNSNITIRDMAIKVGITERAVVNIVSDLNKNEYLNVTKVGRKNNYSINENARLRHPIESHCTIKDFLNVLDKNK